MVNHDKDRKCMSHFLLPLFFFTFCTRLKMNSQMRPILFTQCDQIEENFAVSEKIPLGKMFPNVLLSLLTFKVYLQFIFGLKFIYFGQSFFKVNIR